MSENLNRNRKPQADEIKIAARGREVELLERVAGISAEILDGRGHPCPRCGGTDRFSLIDREAGAVLCRRCFDKNNGDFLAAIAWARGVTFSQACILAAVYLNVGDKVYSAADHRTKKAKQSKRFSTAAAAVAEVERKHGKRSQSWTYHNAAGEPVGLVLRWNLADGGKDIRPVSRLADGWHLAGMPEPRPLYCLPNIAAAETVIVCEGEKAADAAVGLGFIATTSPHGSKSAAKADWSPLAGKQVAIVPDHDEPGTKYAEQVASILAQLSPPAQTKIVNLPGLNEGDDLVEWVGNGGTKDQLQALIDAAPAWNPQPAAEPTDWPEPSPVVNNEPEVPPFNPQLLPVAFREFVCDVAERMQAPPDFAAVAMMIVAGTALGARIVIRPKSKDDWYEVPNLWGAVIGRPSLLKTPSIREPLKMLHRLTAEEKKRFAAETDIVGNVPAIAQAESKMLKAKIESAIKKGDKSAAIELAKQLTELESGGSVPPPRRYIVNDASIEKLGEILQANPLGVLQYRDELLGFLRKFENEQYAGDRAAWLELWDGKGCHITDRIGRGTIEIDRACASLIGSIQPSPLQAYFANATDGGAGDDGLIQRFQLMVWPIADREWRLIDRFPNTAAKSQAWESIVTLNKLDPIAVGAVSDDDGSLPYLRFSPAAQIIFNDWLTTLEQTIRADDIHPAMEAHLAKYRGLMPTLALLCHLADGQAGPVGDESACRAVAWCDYLAGHARRVYHAAEHPEVSAAVRLLQKINKGALKDGFTARDVYRKGWQGLDQGATTKAVEVLIDHGWLRQEESQEPGGRKRIKFRIHPSAFKTRGPTDKADRTDNSPPSALAVSCVSNVSLGALPDSDENEVIEWTA